jgi:hypothetical protein
MANLYAFVRKTIHKKLPKLLQIFTDTLKVFLDRFAISFGWSRPALLEEVFLEFRGHQIPIFTFSNITWISRGRFSLAFSAFLKLWIRRSPLLNLHHYRLENWAAMAWAHLADFG